MARHFAANGITLLIVVLVMVLGLLNWGRETYFGPGPLAESTVIEIPRGANLERATQQLVEAGAISSPMVFRIGARYEGRDQDLKFGVYEIPAAATMDEVLDIIVSGAGASSRYRVTFNINARGLSLRQRDLVAGETAEAPETLEAGLAEVEALIESGESVAFRVSTSEGLTVREVLEGIAAIPYLEGAVPDSVTEGMLAPDTYDMRRGGSRADLVATMASAQAARLRSAWAGVRPDVPLASPDELLTLASIIEKETGVAEERGVVAAVFVNRLKQGMRLQTDPTITYGITRGEVAMDRPISRSDINGVTEQRQHGSVVYNTYQIDGLPPGPIANPGRAALLAAANPEASDFLFFVADGTGGHAFAKTLEEHNRNVAAYRALQAD